MSRTAKVFGLVFVSLIVVAAFFPGVLAPNNPLAVDPAEAFQTPSLDHPFGTDESGRDVYTRVIHGTADSLTIGISATALGMGIAILLAVVAAFGPRWIDATVLRLLEVLYAIPALLLALLIIALYGARYHAGHYRSWAVYRPGYARLIRTQLWTLVNSEMFDAATVLGHSQWQKCETI